MSFIDHVGSEESDQENESCEDESEEKQNIRIVTRKEWGAKKPKKELPRIPPVSLIHCFNTYSRDCNSVESCSEILRNIQATHMTEPFFLPDIRFNFLIHENGTIYEGRGWGYEPSLPSNFSHFNHKTLLIGYIGHFTEKNIGSSIGNSREYLIEYGLEKNYIRPEYEVISHLNNPR